MRLALALLVAGVLADDANHVFALHDATGFAKALDGCSHFHSWADSVFGDKKSRWRSHGFPVRSRLHCFWRKVIRPLVRS